MRTTNLDNLILLDAQEYFLSQFTL